MKLKMYRSLPTWCILIALAPFLPIDHPLYNTNISLKDWYNSQTSLCKCMDLMFWVSFIMFIEVLIIIIAKSI